MPVSTADPNWLFQMTDPFEAKAAPVGFQAGAQRLGATLYELGAGACASPMHLHHGNEELLVVLSGMPAIRRREGRAQLSPGDVVSFRAGPEGAHRVENDGPDPARVLIVSTMSFPDVVEHLDSDKVLVMMGPPAAGGEMAAFRRDDAVHPSYGEEDIAPRDLEAGGEDDEAEG
jgi:uncharacterized cupin superfamily protein